MSDLKKDAREIIKAGADGLESLEVYDLELAKRYKVKAKKVSTPEADKNPPEKIGDDGKAGTPDDTTGK